MRKLMGHERGDRVSRQLRWVPEKTSSHVRDLEYAKREEDDIYAELSVRECAPGFYGPQNEIVWMVNVCEATDKDYPAYLRLSATGFAAKREDARRDAEEWTERMFCLILRNRGVQ